MTPSFDQVADLLSYCPATGLLTWKVSRPSYAGHVRPGARAGTNSHGYIKVTVCQKQIPGHRVAWLLQTGSWPPKGMDIDHINGDRADNRWCNLRIATRSQNNMNKSGVQGVYMRAYRSGNTKWHARITVGGRVILLGHFDAEADAVAARQAAEIEHFGEYRRAA